jgi:glycosyltransferase involved in cell wall biosynthesis
MTIDISFSSYKRFYFRVKYYFQRRVVLKASKMFKTRSTVDAINYIKRHGSPEAQRVTNLLKANLATANNDNWLLHVNEYFAQFNIAPLKLKTSKKNRFSRLSSAPGYKIDQGPKVSIIMPVFNAEATLVDAVDSILQQTWQNIELIIVDDSSTDGSLACMKSLAVKDERIKVLCNCVNVGPYVSKNRALDHVTGNYITGHDADDWAHPQRIERHLAAMTAKTGTKASIAHMLRANEQVEFTSFCIVGSNSFDGIARRAYISTMFETDTFKSQLGYWDSVRFGGDSELIERARTILGPAFQTVNLVTMICLDIAGTLTNHPEHGIKANGGGLSTTRLEYKEKWQQWHKSLHVGNAYLDFPQIKRNFDAPEIMLVDSVSMKMLQQQRF